MSKTPEPVLDIFTCESVPANIRQTYVLHTETGTYHYDPDLAKELRESANDPQIESDIPIPQGRGKGREVTPENEDDYVAHAFTGRYPWRELKVGQSFVAPTIVQVSLSQTGRRVGCKFKGRRINQDQVRIWRVS